MRYGILIERNEPVRILEGGARVRGRIGTHRALDAQLQAMLSDGQVSTSVYVSVREADEEGNFLPGSSLVCGRMCHLPELADFFTLYQVDTGTGIGRVFVPPALPVAQEDNALQIQAAVQAAVAAVRAEQEETLAFLQAQIKELQPVPQPTLGEEDFEALTVPELKELALEHGVEGFESMKKAALVEALLVAEE